MVRIFSVWYIEEGDKEIDTLVSHEYKEYLEILSLIEMGFYGEGRTNRG